ncbi:MAG: TetR/AcrR family transcriptional regulator [Candidatus Babeliales bacterium]
MVRTVKKPEDRKVEIISAARHLFELKGYDKVTMQDVMGFLGVAKGTIYHYFKSKEELFEAVIEDIVDTSIERMQILLQEATGTALEKMQMLIAAGNISVEHEKLLGALHARNDVMHARLLARAVTKQAVVYAQVIEQGCKEGVFQTESPQEVAEFMLSGVQFLIDKGIYPWTHEDLVRRANAFPGILENLLKAPKGSFDFLPNLLNSN